MWKMHLISDASVLIDMENGALTSFMFRLPYTFVVPDVLFFEELKEKHEHLLELGLAVRAMDGALVSAAYQLRQKYPKLSLNDLFALVLARHNNYLLLTGDKGLRTVAQHLDVGVHGTIWLAKEIIKHTKVSYEIMYAAFDKMKNAGSRLPWHEIDKLLKDLDKQSEVVFEH